MLNKDLVDKLRQMFVDGATPSLLMHHIANHHPDDCRLHFTIKDYFAEAFGIPLLRNVVSDEDYSPNQRHAHFNRDVAPEMVQRISSWNSANLEGTWLESLRVASMAEHTERLKTSKLEELERVWSHLNEKERRFIVRKVAVNNHDWERLKTLSALVERLQQKVTELEGILNGMATPNVNAKS